MQNHEDGRPSLIRALIDAIRCVITNKAGTLAIIKKHCAELLKMQNDEEWSCYYEIQAASLEPKPYPTLDAIQNVFALALKIPKIQNFNPLALWDLHYLREFDGSHYINSCTGKHWWQMTRLSMSNQFLSMADGKPVGHLYVVGKNNRADFTFGYRYSR